MNFLEELTWRGLVQDYTPLLKTLLNQKKKISGYIGFDPTSDSLHIGSLVPIFLLAHFQRKGHKPYALIGGATGLVGDPSGKSEERNLIDKEKLRYNQECLKIQLEKFLDFTSSNAAVVINNFDWFQEIRFLNFIRDIGKHISINYMLAKESVQKRLENGLSFTEFSYQLIQGYDFYHLEKECNCIFQMGGADQWGNITTGIELIRRISGRQAIGLTTPLLTKSSGQKFGKTEKGNIWLSKEKTSVYQFHQFWMNISDEEALRYIKIFTFLSPDEISMLEKQHREAPHLRILQNEISKCLTSWVHSPDDYIKTKEASQILFGKSTKEQLENIDESVFLEAFEGVPLKEVKRKILEAQVSLAQILSKEAGFMSYSDSLRNLKQGAISVNKIKVSESYVLNPKDLINQKYILIQKGRKNFFILRFSA